MKLAIISHTPHYEENGVITGWGPTIREINRLTEIFDEIFHIAPLHREKAPGSSLPYDSDKIKFVAIRPYGGERFSDKFSILTTAPHNLNVIRSILKKVDWVQFRAPTAMGMYVLPYLSLRSKPKLWVKYAGNWNMEKPPLSYAFQKWWLKNNLQRSKVTINGRWEGQRDHVVNFQNPCLDNEELLRARKASQEKNFEGPLTICFVGTLTKNKGVDIMLEALAKTVKKDKIQEVIIAGDGIEREKYEQMAEGTGLKVTFKGMLKRNELEEIYKISHLIILPSESEGFPKVIAEASAYGCIPIVSDISSISLYYNESNSFLLKKINADELSEKINNAIVDRRKLKRMSDESVKVAEQFTFENYMKNLLEKILSN